MKVRGGRRGGKEHPSPVVYTDTCHVLCTPPHPQAGGPGG